MTRKIKPFFAALLALLLALTCMVPLVHAENATPETASDAAQNFIDAVNALDRGAIISASNAWGLASQAAQIYLSSARAAMVVSAGASTYGFTLSEQVYTVTLGWDNQRNDLVLAQSITANGDTAKTRKKKRPSGRFSSCRKNRPAGSILTIR